MSEQKAASSREQIGTNERRSVPMTPSERMEATAQLQRLSRAHHATTRPSDCTYCGARVGEAHSEPCSATIQARKAGLRDE